MVTPVLVVVFHLGLKRLMDGWASGGTSRRSGQPECGNMPNAERLKGAILGRGAKRDFPVQCGVPKAVVLVVPRTGRAGKVRVVCVSNVIYQNGYLIRLINVSAFLSN